MILHIPHSSTYIPQEQKKCISLSDKELDYEILCMTDMFTDELFSSCVSTRDNIITFPISRLVVDPERFVNDDDEIMSKIGMGVIYNKTSVGHELRVAATKNEKKYLIEKYYSPHHQLLTSAVEQSLAQNGEALIIDCHSFPSVPLPYELNQNINRPDICIGTDTFHTRREMSERLVSEFKALGYNVCLNKPFAGSLVPQVFYKKDPRVQSVMIEVNRKLYMDETTGNKSDGFDQVQSDLKAITNKITVSE